MRLEIASYKAIKYACINFHYAKRVPSQPMVGYSVFNNAREWCGCIVFNAGIEGIQKPYGLKRGQVCELVRVAMNGKQQNVTKPVSIAIKLLKKTNPLLKLIVSYADTDEKHEGIIYQAGNWYFTGSKRTSDKFIDPRTGKSIHSRAHSSTGFKKQFGVMKKVPKTSTLIRIKKGPKHKYIYPLDKSLIPICRELSKPYPKKAQVGQR